MAKYRKRPVEIEAVQWDGANYLITETFMKGSGAVVDQSYSKLGVILIPTLEGVMTAQVGDWIIKGTHGEFYPCKPDIFEQIYEEVADDFIGRIVEEKAQLNERAEKLAGFINSPQFMKLGTLMQNYMVEQYDVMKRYSVLLEKRLNLLGQVLCDNDAGSGSGSVGAGAIADRSPQ